MGINRITIAGTNSGCGKTTISMGIMAALCDMGFSVQPFKVGPDYIDPMFHKFITGKDSRNLDSWMLDEDTVTHIFERNAKSADVSVIEGVMGLYDGLGGSTAIGSTAHVSKILKSPVILVVSGKGASLSIVPVIKGFMDYDRDAHIKGVIINNVNSESHYSLLKRNIEVNTGIYVLGYLPQMDEYTLPSRHLGLIPDGEIKDLKDRIGKLANQVKNTIDLELLMKVSSESSSIKSNIKNTNLFEESGPCNVRIAVARDKAFNFYYKDNLELLEMMGAELIYFSPMSDTCLPEGVNGLYIGGGYPEVFAKVLQDNRLMKESIKKHIIKGIPAYAECGGMMYLSESIADKSGMSFQMVGILPGRCEMTDRLKRFGYVDIEVTHDNVISKKGYKIRAHEFHYSYIKMCQDVRTCYKVIKNRPYMGSTDWECGYKLYNLLAGYPHLHFWGNINFAAEFINNCKRV
ncbi:MAG: cobyrinate a,c-diamide synthase [Bacillota bacterium]